MSLLMEVEKGIDQLDAATFQKFCDELLKRENPSWTLCSYGLQVGAAKTIKGNPDTYFCHLRENGSSEYVLVAYTTQKTELYAKLEEDIRKCLDESASGLRKEEISRIFLCHTSNRLSVGEDRSLRELAGKIQLEIWGINELAMRVYKNHPSMLKDYLGIPMGTEQIFDIDQFVKSYNARGLVAPLDTDFLFRTEELKILSDLIEKNAVTVLSGSAGVGKTRLTLEVCRQLSSREEGRYHCICVQSKGISIFEDFKRYLPDTGRCLIFIDDANQLKELRAILLYVSQLNVRAEQCKASAEDNTLVAEGKCDIHVILTVRDYMRKAILNEINDCQISYAQMRAEPLTDEEIEEFLNNVVGIQDRRCIDQILRIAAGNPRIAYMAGKVTQSELSGITSVAEVMKLYYQSSVDKCIGENAVLCKTAGLLAAFGRVKCTNLECLSEIFYQWNLPESVFRNALDELVRMELAESKENVELLSDPCFADYILYYVFVDRKIAPFSDALDVGFRHYRSSVLEAISTILNTFGNAEVLQEMSQQVKIVWARYQNSDEKKLYEEFLESYHTFDLQKTLEYVRDKLKSYSDRVPENLDFTLPSSEGKGNERIEHDHILTLLGDYRETEDCFETALEMALWYGMRSEHNLVSFYYWFLGQYKIDAEACYNGYKRQKKAVAYLKEHCLENVAVGKMCVAIAAQMLAVDWHNIEAVGKKKVRVSQIVLENSVSLQELRTELLRMVVFIAAVPKNANKENGSAVMEWRARIKVSLIRFLVQYTEYIRQRMDEQIVHEEEDLVADIFRNISDDFAKAYVAHLFRVNYKCRGIHWSGKIHDGKCRKTKEWIFYQKVSYNTEMRFGKGNLKYNSRRLNRIRTFALELDEQGIIDAVHSAEKCIDAIHECASCPGEAYKIARGLMDLGSNYMDDENHRWTFLRALQANGKNIELIPEDLFLCEMNRDAKAFYHFISENQYSSLVVKNNWQWAFFVILPIEKADYWMWEKLQEFLQDDSDKDMMSCESRDLFLLEKFENVEKNAILKLIRIAYDKIKYSIDIAVKYLELLFVEGPHSKKNPKDLLKLFRHDPELLKEIYFLVIAQSMDADYHGTYFCEFYRMDPGWIKAYATFVFGQENRKFIFDVEKNRLKGLWEQDNYLDTFDELFATSGKAEITKEKSARNLVVDQNEVRAACCWSTQWTLKKLLGHLYSDQKIAERQKKWILHLVELTADTSLAENVFVMAEDLNDDFRKEMFQCFLRWNPTYEAFEKLPLVPRDQAWIASRVPVLENEIAFLKSLLELVGKMKYLYHKRRIIDMIEALGRDLQNEKTADVLEND